MNFLHPLLMLVTLRCASVLCTKGHCKDGFAEDREASNLFPSTERALVIIVRPTYHWNRHPTWDVAERAVKNKVTDGMEKHSLLEKGQPDYRKGKPCLIDLLEFGGGVSEHMDNMTS